MNFDLRKIDALAGLLAAEMDGKDFDRDAARSLAHDIRREWPAVRETMDLVITRLGQPHH